MQLFLNFIFLLIIDRFVYIHFSVDLVQFRVIYLILYTPPFLFHCRFFFFYYQKEKKNIFRCFLLFDFQFWYFSLPSFLFHILSIYDNSQNKKKSYCIFYECCHCFNSLLVGINISNAMLILNILYIWNVIFNLIS